MRTFIAAATILALLACRGEPPAQAQALDQQRLEALVDSLMPHVSRATGLRFQATPRSGIRTRDEVRGYLLARLEQELPPERLDGIVTTYRLLGMLPDTLDVKQLIVDLYTEQVAGFYDPDSSVLYAVGGSDGMQLRLILAHELVHALQHQYVPIDSIMRDIHNSDRLAAAQAVLEGHATVATVAFMTRDSDALNNDGFWATYAQQVRTTQASMPVFRRAPLILREGLIFPYLGGAEFVRWYQRNRGRDEQPFGATIATSTEQVLHPERYARGDTAIAVEFAGDTTGVAYDDTQGELTIAILRSAIAGIDQVPTDLPLGWGGDRLRVYRSPAGPALVWYTAWDTPRDADLFRQRIADRVVAQPRAGYRKVVEPVAVGGRAGMRLVIAPEAWAGWGSIPAVR